MYVCCPEECREIGDIADTIGSKIKYYKWPSQTSELSLIHFGTNSIITSANFA